MSERPARQRPQRSRLGLLLVVGVAGWLIWRVVVGSGPDFDKLAFRPLPYVMYGLKPDFTRQGELVKTTNADGFRGAAIAHPKPAGTYRIVCLGGSTTYTSFVDDAASYPALLQEELRVLRPDLGIEVINAGVESYTSAESLANLAFRCLDLDPDAVVVYHAANDVRVRRYPDFEGGYEHYRKSWDGSTDKYETGEPGGELAGGINPLIQHAPRESGTDLDENLRRHGPETFRRNLLSLVGIARAHDVLPVLVTFAPSDEHASANMKAGVLEHNEVIRELCREKGVACVDFGPRMPQDPELWVDSVHVTAKGAAIKARLIAEELAGHLP